MVSGLGQLATTVVATSRRVWAAGCVAAVVVGACLLPASAAHAGERAKVSALFGVSSKHVTVTGTVGRTPRGTPGMRSWRVLLERKAGRRWARQAAGRVIQQRQGRRRVIAYRLAWKAPAKAGAALLRVRVVARRRTIAQSRARKLNLRGAALTQPDVTRVRPAEIRRLPTRTSKVLVLNGNHALLPGEFVATAPSAKVPSGFLLKVVAPSTSSDGKTTLRVAPGDLFEAVPNGSFSADLADLPSASAANADARRIARAAARGAADIPFSRTVACGGVSFELSGRVKLALQPHLSAEWGTTWGLVPHLEQAEGSVRASIDASASAKLAFAGACEPEPITLAEPSWTTVVAVGYVPVPITVSIPVTLKTSVTASGAVTVSASAGGSGRLGVKYEDGDFSGIKDFRTHSDLSREIAGTATAQALVGPALNLKAGWEVPVLGELAVFAEIGAASGLRASVDTGRTPPGKVCVPFVVHGELGVDLFVKSFSKELTLFDEDLRCLPFGEAPPTALYSGVVRYQAFSHDKREQSVGRTIDNGLVTEIRFKDAPLEGGYRPAAITSREQLIDGSPCRLVRGDMTTGGKVGAKPAINSAATLANPSTSDQIVVMEYDIAQLPTHFQGSDRNTCAHTAESWDYHASRAPGFSQGTNGEGVRLPYPTPAGHYRDQFVQRVDDGGIESFIFISWDITVRYGTPPEGCTDASAPGCRPCDAAGDCPPADCNVDVCPAKPAGTSPLAPRAQDFGDPNDEACPPDGPCVTADSRPVLFPGMKREFTLDDCASDPDGEVTLWDLTYNDFAVGGWGFIWRFDGTYEITAPANAKDGEELVLRWVAMDDNGPLPEPGPLVSNEATVRMVVRVPTEGSPPLPPGPQPLCR